MSNLDFEESRQVDANVEMSDTNDANESLDDGGQKRVSSKEANSNVRMDKDLNKESEASQLLKDTWNGSSRGTTGVTLPFLLDNRKTGSIYHSPSNENDVDNAVLGLNTSRPPSKNNSHSGPVSISPRSALTLANSHPLMFPDLPNEHDSDSEQEARPMNQQPVSYSQPLRLNKPITTPERPTIRTTTKVFTSAHNSTIICESNNLTPPLRDREEGRKDVVDFGSSDEELDVESEPDISQYQANVNPLYQSVVLVSRPDHQPHTVQRKIPVSADLLSDSMSSLDSMSQHSFDEDLEHNLVSVSISSSVLDDTGFNLGDGATGGATSVDDIASPASLPQDPTPAIPQYSATDEARDTRSWQKITLPDGRTREIDMKVIEPYKRVLSHGGYLNSGGHNAIVVFSACHLPDRSRKDYHYVMDNLFLYVVKTLDQLITDDYVLVYLHGGASRSNAPQFPWLKRCYQLLDRRLRKSLKTLYMVHPTFWLKSVVWMARPFISSKFWRKLVYVRTLDEMFHHVPVERAAVPEKVRKYDLKYT